VLRIEYAPLDTRHLNALTNDLYVERVCLARTSEPERDSGAHFTPNARNDLLYGHLFCYRLSIDCQKNVAIFYASAIGRAVTNYRKHHVTGIIPVEISSNSSELTAKFIAFDLSRSWLDEDRVGIFIGGHKAANSTVDLLARIWNVTKEVGAKEILDAPKKIETRRLGSRALGLMPPNKISSQKRASQRQGQYKAHHKRAK
jgi:hypothetical protein